MTGLDLQSIEYTQHSDTMRVTEKLCSSLPVNTEHGGNSTCSVTCPPPSCHLQSSWRVSHRAPVLQVQTPSCLEPPERAKLQKPNLSKQARAHRGIWKGCKGLTVGRDAQGRGEGPATSGRGLRGGGFPWWTTLGPHVQQCDSKRVVIVLLSGFTVSSPAGTSVLK